ncbi:YHS domain-containing protein [Desulfuromonas sp.]|uniref:YHS domain-containing protein n=1 Tax=Desulfuromonas sp. TaxID=892 RepID=UPI0025C43634|nr:YHS domain-containing protein [Desulfuromonas sp.]
MLLLALLFFLGYSLVQAVIRSLPRRGGGPSRDKSPQGEDMVQDPHCGTYVPRGDSLTKTVRGKVFHFCSEECRDAFSGRR